MKTPKYILILFLGFCSFVFAQKTTANFTKEINFLNTLGQQIIANETDEVKYKANEEYKTALKKLITNKHSFDFNFDSLKTSSILKANDLKIYNWAIPLTDGTFEYFAFLQIQKSKENYQIIELIDKSEIIKTPESKILTPKNWYGALYYKIIYNKKLGEDYYTLLGWDGNNLLTNKKIIDVINISNNGIVTIGAPIFKRKKKIKKRIIFEYSENAVMSLKYHTKIKKIVFDFLAPTSSRLKGVHEYYGPTLNRFDALTLIKGKWLYEEDIDIELDRSIKDFMWKDPNKK